MGESVLKLRIQIYFHEIYSEETISAVTPKESTFPIRQVKHTL